MDVTALSDIPLTVPVQDIIKGEYNKHSNVML